MFGRNICGAETCRQKTGETYRRTLLRNRGNGDITDLSIILNEDCNLNFADPHRRAHHKCSEEEVPSETFLVMLRLIETNSDAIVSSPWQSTVLQKHC